MARWQVYALTGAVLSLGAPLGLFLVQLARSRSQGPALLTAQLARDWPTYLYVSLSTLVVFAVFGGVLGRQADRLATLSGEDPLTGLFNNLGFHERLTQELASAERYQLPLSLIVIDVEIAGEPPGGRGGRRREADPATLAAVAVALHAGSRGPDVAARLADLRFALLAPCTSAAAAASLAERLRLLVQSAAGAVEAGVKVGVSTAGPGSIGTAHALLDAAISALEATGGGQGAATPALAVAPQAEPGLTEPH